MGNVRTSHVKNLAQKLIDLYPKKFTEDFKKNKQKVEVLTKGTSKKIKNKVAGYITHLVKISDNPLLLPNNGS